MTAKPDNPRLPCSALTFRDVCALVAYAVLLFRGFRGVGAAAYMEADEMLAARSK